MIEELKNLPDISFIDKMTIEDVQSFLISKYEQKYAELSERDSYSLPKANIYRIILNANAELIYQALQYIDRAGKQNMLKDTYGEYLDNLAALKGVKRNPAQAATVTMRFALESARGSATGIPAGTRVSDGGDVYFSVPEYTEIPPGAAFVDCKVKCLAAGKSGNGFAVGEINVLVDPVMYIDSVVNIEESANGADVETDDALRKRVFYAPSAYSCAGPIDAYIYWVQSFSNNIADISVTTEENTAIVDIRVLLENGRLPDESFLESLLEYISADDKKPLTDCVRVSAPVPVEYSINFKYYINQSDRARAAMIQSAVIEAVEKYKQWQNGKIGRDINPDKLKEYVMAAGAKRVEISAPIYSTISDDKVAILYDGGNKKEVILEFESGGIDHASGIYTDSNESNYIRTPANAAIRINQFNSLTITADKELVSKYAVRIWFCDETGKQAIDNSYSTHQLNLSSTFESSTYDKNYFGNFIRLEIHPRNAGVDLIEEEAKSVLSIEGQGMVSIEYGGLEND